MTDRVELLDYADKVLDGDYGLGVRATRTAALLARRAFEEWLEEMCADWSSADTYRPPTTVSKLVAVGALHGEEVGERAKSLWHGLSRAAHHHAYELAPSEGEVRALVSGVRQLAVAH